MKCVCVEVQCDNITHAAKQSGGQRQKRPTPPRSGLNINESESPWPEFNSPCVMPIEDIHVPFTFTTVWGGFGKGGGVVRTEPNGLAIEYEIHDNIIGLIRTGVRKIQIPISEVGSVEVQNGMVFKRLVIRTKSLGPLGDIPREIPTELSLVIVKQDIAEAEHLSTALLLARTQQELKRVEDRKS